MNMNQRSALKHFATYTWDEESDEAAEEFIQWYVERFRPELERQREYTWSLDALSDIEYWIREVANDERESVIVYDLEAGEVLFVRYGDRDSVTMQTLQQKLAEGREIFLIHNHPNNSGASPADLSAAAWLDAEYMIIVNPDGTVHRHKKIGGEIVELEPIHNPDIVAPVDPVETAVDSIAYWIQTLREIGNPPEMVMRQEEATADIEVSGSFRAYGNQWYADARRAEPKTFMNYDFNENPQTFKVLGRSALNPSLIQIEVPNPVLNDVYRHWINLEDLEDKFRILEGNLETIPIKYARQSIIADEELDIELTTYPDWADRTKKGVLSRDLNPRGWPPPFEVQSPVIGPDVRVEYVITEDQVHKGLGNTVIISFPANVFQEDAMLMQRLVKDPDHDPTQWRKDGRVFYSFAHLSHIPEHITQGSVIDSRDKAIIGTTGNTGLINPITKELYDDEHTNRHLDLIIVYFGSIDDTSGQMQRALRALRPYEGTVDAFFGFAERSNLYLPDGHRLLSLYGENIDPVRVEPEHDKDGQALDENKRSIYPSR